MNSKQLQRWGIAIILTLLVMNIATLSGLWYITMFDRRPSHEPREAMRFGDMIAQRLELTETQEQEFNQLHNAHRKTKDSLESKIFLLSSEALDEVFAQMPDTLRMNALADSIGALHAEFEKQLFRHFLDIKTLIRPEQMPKLEPLLRGMINFSKRPPPPPKHLINNRRTIPDDGTLPQLNDKQAMPGNDMPSHRPPPDRRQDAGKFKDDRGHRPPPRQRGR